MKKIYHYHIFNKNRGDQAIQQSIWNMMNHAVPEEIKWIKKDLNNDECTKEVIEEMNDTGDMLIIGGSGLYCNFTWRQYKGAYWYFPCDEALFDTIRIPIVLWSLGINRDFHSDYLYPEAKNSILHMNAIAKLSSVRDVQTGYFLDNPNMLVVPDPAICLDWKKNMESLPADTFRIGVNIAAHTKYANRVRNEMLPVIRNLLSSYESVNTKVSFYYLMHHPEEQKYIDELDVEFSKIINTNPKEMLVEYSTMDFVVNMMHHSQVFCANVGKACINFPYNVKNVAFTETLNAFGRLTCKSMNWCFAEEVKYLLMKGKE